MDELTDEEWAELAGLPPGWRVVKFGSLSPEAIAEAWRKHFESAPTPPAE